MKATNGESMAGLSHIMASKANDTTGMDFITLMNGIKSACINLLAAQRTARATPTIKDKANPSKTRAKEWRKLCQKLTVTASSKSLPKASAGPTSIIVFAVIRAAISQTISQNTATAAFLVDEIKVNIRHLTSDGFRRLAVENPKHGFKIALHLLSGNKHYV